MVSILSGIAATIVLTVVAGFVLSGFFEEPTSTRYATSAVRLDRGMESDYEGGGPVESTPEEAEEATD